MDDDDSNILLAWSEIAGEFLRVARSEFKERHALWPVDLAQNEIHEVVGALLARQLTLAAQLANSPSIWTHDVAPLLLRAMADVHITMAWILRDPLSRSQKFIWYGLGQMKLQLEHRRADITTRKPLNGEVDQIEALEDWINTQRATFLTNVNLGSWSGASTRQMAEEADCLDFYNYVYSPFSACVHSTWNHVALHNLKLCRNPLHRFHSVPQEGGNEIDANYLYLAAKYLQKTFSAFDDFLNVKLDHPSAFDLVNEKL